MRYLMTPLGAAARGLAAGAAGAFVQDLFFKATAKVAPPTPKDVFVPPEPQQAGETATATVARRLTEGFLKRGPLDEAGKARAATLVHYGFGADWGSLWGAARESYPRLNGPWGILGFSSLVWLVGDNTLLPLFKLSAWPQAYPARTHAYAWAAHLAYGLGVWASYEMMRQPFWDLAGAFAWAIGARRAARKLLPRFARPAARRAIAAAAGFKAARPLSRVADFVRA